MSGLKISAMTSNLWRGYAVTVQGRHHISFNLSLISLARIHKSTSPTPSLIPTLN